LQLYNKLAAEDKYVLNKIFLPLLEQLDIKNIPNIPKHTTINLADYRDFRIEGLANCIITIKQEYLPRNIGGALITTHKVVYTRDGNGNYNQVPIISFRLVILIEKKLCNRTTNIGRSWMTLTAIHEYTHAIAALSTILKAKGNSYDVINKFGNIFKNKIDILDYGSIRKIFRDLSTPLLTLIINKNSGIPMRWHFDNTHFRIGFEDIKSEYPIIFEEFLLPDKIFKKYFSDNIIKLLKLLFEIKDNILIQLFINTLVTPIFKQMYTKENLPREFIKKRFSFHFIPNI